MEKNSSEKSENFWLWEEIRTFKECGMWFESVVKVIK